MWIDDIPLHLNAIILAGTIEFTTHIRNISDLLVLMENIPLYPNPIILAGSTKFTTIKSTGFFP